MNTTLREGSAAPGAQAASGVTRLRIDLAYNGTPFKGFAKQPGLETIQAKVEAALELLLGQPLQVTCAGRTDAGVHAQAQVLHVDVPTGTSRVDRYLLNIEKFAMALSHASGPYITIWHVARVPQEFHARFSALWRQYRYTFVAGEPVDPLMAHRVWDHRKPLSITKMREASKLLVGEHDFRTFCKVQKDRHGNVKHARRELQRVVLRHTRVGMHDKAIQMVVRGNAFGHSQVRAIAGALAEVGKGEEPVEWIGELLAAKTRDVAPDTAPARGLVLESVGYPDPYPDAPFR